jgi:isopenicillin N synthase-like dioxygenase
MSIANLPVVDLTASSSQQLREMTSAADKAGFFFVKPTPQQRAKISSLTFALKEAARVHVFDQSMERKYQLACGDMQARLPTGRRPLIGNLLLSITSSLNSGV